MRALSFESPSGDQPFERLLDLFFRSESVTCFASLPDQDEDMNRIMKDMAEGRLAPGDVQELFGKVRSDTTAIARLAALLQKPRNETSESGE